MLGEVKKNSIKLLCATPSTIDFKSMPPHINRQFRLKCLNVSMNPSSRPLQDSEFETKNQARDDEIDHCKARWSSCEKRPVLPKVKHQVEMFQ
jgi:hypothetical protein